MKILLRRFQFAALLLSAVLLATACHREPQVLTVGGDFTLTDQNGTPFQLSSLRGNAVLVFFGYTSCPDVCPTTLSKIASVYRQLGPDAARVRTVYISVDTRRDTPAVLKEYLNNFSSLHAIGLTGSVPQIDKVAAQYGASYEISPAAGPHTDYTVAHTTYVYGLDPKGRTRLLFPYDATVAQMSEGIREILR